MVLTFSVQFHKIGTNYQRGIDEVIADGFIPESGHRFFIQKDGTRHEIPTRDMDFIFSAARMDLLQAAEKKRASENVTA